MRRIVPFVIFVFIGLGCVCVYGCARTETRPPSAATHGCTPRASKSGSSKNPPAKLGPSLYFDPSAEDFKTERQRYVRLGLRHTDLTKKFSPSAFLLPAEEQKCEALRREGEVMVMRHLELDRQALLISANLGVELIGYELGRLTHAGIREHLEAYEKTLDAMTKSVEFMKSKERELLRCVSNPDDPLIISSYDYQLLTFLQKDPFRGLSCVLESQCKQYLTNFSKHVILRTIKNGEMSVLRLAFPHGEKTELLQNERQKMTQGA